MPILLFLVGLVVVGLVAYLSHLHEQKRREGFSAFARSRGWSYTHEKDFQFDDVFRSLPFVGQGSKRYLRHRMQGVLGDSQLRIGEYHYQITTNNGKSSSTRHYYSALVMLKPSFSLKDLSIRREGVFDRFKAAFGWEDIDFASAEFSRRFHVSAPDRNWAFAFIQPRTMDHLMQTRDLEVHLRRGWMVLRIKGKLQVEALPGMIHTAENLLQEVPAFAREEGR